MRSLSRKGNHTSRCVYNKERTAKETTVTRAMGGMTRSGRVTADVVAEDSSGGCHGKLRRGVLRAVRKAEEPPRGTAVHAFMRSTTCLGTGAACEPSNKNRKQPKRLIVVYRECFNERKGEMRSDGGDSSRSHEIMRGRTSGGVLRCLLVMSAELIYA